MYSRDQLLLEQAYQQTVQENKGRWNFENICNVLKEHKFRLGERLAKKDDIQVELRTTKARYVYVRVLSESNKFSELTFGGDELGDLNQFNETLEKLTTQN